MCVGAIAQECGFNSYSHLGRKFRHLTGITPKAYRAQQKVPLAKGKVVRRQISLNSYR
ncbi:helix-turn-helix domain-containing protein [Sphaerothrix gracilis]|uniref:helix-turn-helix domain-containing protein n=1 Tax=Sphaerothrix gracilis TaxID=3151835 RepID=UPI003D15F31C